MCFCEFLPTHTIALVVRQSLVVYDIFFLGDFFFFFSSEIPLMFSSILRNFLSFVASFLRKWVVAVEYSVHFRLICFFRDTKSISLSNGIAKNHSL